MVWAAWVQVALNAASFLALVITALFACLAWRAAKRAAVATEAQAATALDIGNRQLRAYIGVTNAITVFELDKGASFTFSVTIKNYGLTPASGLYYDRIADWTEEVDPRFDPIALPSEHNRIMSFELPPGETHEIELKCDYPEPQQTRMRKGLDPKHARLCFYGVIFYRTFDQPTDDSPRETGFLYMVPDPVFPLDAKPRKMEAARKGNYST